MSDKSIEALRAERQAACDLYGKIFTDLKQCEARIDEIDGIARARTAARVYEDPVTHAAIALINGDIVPEPATDNPMEAERQALARRAKILRTALQMQDVRKRESILKLSLAESKERRPEYRALLLDHVQAVINLTRTTERHRAFVEDMEANGLLVSEGLGYANLVPHASFFGELSNPFSRINGYLKELKAGGWISDSEIQDMTA